MKPLFDPVAWVWFLLLGAGLWLWMRKKRRASVLLTGLAVVWWLIEFLALPTRLLAGLEQQNPAAPGPWDVVVVLGGGWSPADRTSVPLEASDPFDRLLVGIEAVRGGRARELWLGGGFGKKDAMTDGEAAREWIMRWSLLPPEKVVVLPASMNTKAEAAHAAERARGLGSPPPRLALVTSAWHMPRALKHFREIGLDPQALPADFQASTALDSRTERGPNWFPRQGSLQHWFLWLTETVGRWG